MLKCPNCGSDKVETERRPDGVNRCANCFNIWKDTNPLSNSEEVKNANPEEPILKFFHYKHLPESLQVVSKHFHDLANDIVMKLPRNAERSSALRKLLEAKDCAIRATL